MRAVAFSVGIERIRVSQVICSANNIYVEISTIL